MKKKEPLIEVCDETVVHTDIVSKIEKSIPKLFAAILAWEKEIVNKATNHTTNQKSCVPVRQEGGFSFERTG